MNIGYIKSLYVLNNDEAYRQKIEQLNVRKLYADKHGENSGLKEMLGYVRQGDNIVVEYIQHLSKSAGEFIELVLDLKQQGAFIICKAQRIDTSTTFWDKLSEHLFMFMEDTSEPLRGRTPRNIEDLDRCFELVDQGELTVEEACKQASS